MDCKVICGFNFSLVNVSLFVVLLLSESTENCPRIIWFGFGRHYAGGVFRR